MVLFSCENAQDILGKRKEYLVQTVEQTPAGTKHHILINLLGFMPASGETTE